MKTTDEILKDLSIEEKINIIEYTIHQLKEHRNSGICACIRDALGYYINRCWAILTIEKRLTLIYPNFTHTDYMRFWWFSRKVKKLRYSLYWDELNYWGYIRRKIYLKHILKQLKNNVNKLYI